MDKILNKIFNKYKQNKNIKFHFILEKKIMTVDQILLWSEDIRKIRKIIPNYLDVKNLLIK